MVLLRRLIVVALALPAARAAGGGGGEAGAPAAAAGADARRAQAGTPSPSPLFTLQPAPSGGVSVNPAYVAGGVLPPPPSAARLAGQLAFVTNVLALPRGAVSSAFAADRSADATRHVAYPVLVSDPAAVALLRGRPWSDEALLGLAAAWPAGGLAAGGGPALPLLALSTGVATLYPAAWTPSTDLNLPGPGRGSLLGARAGGASSSSTPPRAQPADAVLTVRTSPGEDVVLVADLWVTTALPPGAQSRGDATSSTGAPVSRGIPVGRTGYFVPDGTGDSRPGQGGKLSKDSDATTRASPYAAKLPLGYITGLDIAVRSVNWTLTGVPGAAITAVFAARGAQLPHSGASPHVVSLASPTTSMVLPPGTLIPGYVYAAEAAMDMAVALAVDYSALATGTPPTPPT